MKLSAIIFDLDGTAVEPNEKAMPSRTLIKAIEDNKSKIILCAATGRGWSEAKPVLTALKLDKPCIINGGASIVDPKVAETLWEQSIPTSKAQALLRIASKYGYPTDYTIGLTTVKRVDVKTAEINDDINSFYIMRIAPDSPHLDEIIDKVQALGGLRATRAIGWSTKGEIDINITPIDATKEHAVTELCSILGIERDTVAGVGDSHNDLHLFNAVGYKVAIGNAVSELKEASDIVIDRLNNDGLAKFIEEAAQA